MNYDDVLQMREDDVVGYPPTWCGFPAEQLWHLL